MTAPLPDNSASQHGPYQQGQYQGSGRPASPGTDPSRLWAGGVATAAVAAGVAIVGLLLIRGVFDIPVLTPGDGEPLLDEAVAWLPVSAAIAALLATGLLHLLLLSTPRPRMFFAWLVILVVAAIVLQTFMLGSGLYEQLASSALYIVIGVAILSLLSGVADSANPAQTGRR